MEPSLRSDSDYSQDPPRTTSTSSAPAYPSTTAHTAAQHEGGPGMRHTDTRLGLHLRDDLAGPSKTQSKNSGKGKGKETGKSKVKPLKKVHKCTFEGCDKTFITPAHVRRHLRTRE